MLILINNSGNNNRHDNGSNRHDNGSNNTSSIDHRNNSG